MRPSLARNVLYTDVDGTQYAAFITVVRDHPTPPASRFADEEDEHEVYLAILVHKPPPSTATEAERGLASFIAAAGGTKIGAVSFTDRPIPFARAPGVRGTWTWPPRV